MVGNSAGDGMDVKKKTLRVAPWRGMVKKVLGGALGWSAMVLGMLPGDVALGWSATVLGMAPWDEKLSARVPPCLGMVGDGGMVCDGAGGRLGRRR
jgi:hypothetical protein